MWRIPRANPFVDFELNLVEGTACPLGVLPPYPGNAVVSSKGNLAMIKPILTAAAFSFAAATAAWALPVSQTTSLRLLNFSDVIQVGDKNKNKNKNHNHNHDNHNHNHHNHGYYHGG